MPPGHVLTGRVLVSAPAERGESHSPNRSAGAERIHPLDDAPLAATPTARPASLAPHLGPLPRLLLSPRLRTPLVGGHVPTAGRHAHCVRGPLWPRLLRRPLRRLLPVVVPKPVLDVPLHRGEPRLARRVRLEECCKVLPLLVAQPVRLRWLLVPLAWLRPLVPALADQPAQNPPVTQPSRTLELRPPRDAPLAPRLLERLQEVDQEPPREYLAAPPERARLHAQAPPLRLLPPQ